MHIRVYEKPCVQRIVNGGLPDGKGQIPAPQSPEAIVNGKSRGKRHKYRFQRAKKLRSQLWIDGVSLVLILKGATFSNHSLPGFVHSCNAHTSQLCQKCARNTVSFPCNGHSQSNLHFSFFLQIPPQRGPPEERDFHLAQNPICLSSLHNNAMKAQMIFPHLVALRSFSSAQEQRGELFSSFLFTAAIQLKENNLNL